MLVNEKFTITMKYNKITYFYSDVTKPLRNKLYTIYACGKRLKLGFE